MSLKLKKTINRLFFPIALLFVATSFTGAYFSDSASVTGNTFDTGSWNDPVPTSARIVINEVMYRGSAEWIELYNAGSNTVDIKGWIICDDAGHCGSLNPASRTDVAPGEFVLVAHDAADLNSLSIPDGTKKIYYAGNTIYFNDTGGDGAILKNNLGTIIDQMSYDGDTTAFSPSCPSVVSSHSLSRNPLGFDTDSASDFIDLASPTPGS